MANSNPSATFGYTAEQLGTRGIGYLHVIEPEAQNLDVYHINDEVASPTKHLKSIFKGTVVTAQGYDFQSGSQVIESGDADLVAFGKLFIANPVFARAFRQRRAAQSAERRSVLRRRTRLY